VGKKSIKISTLEPSQLHLWDIFVKNSRYGSVFQTSSFLQIVAKSFQRNSVILAAKDGDRIVGGAVLLPLKKFGIYYTTSPFYIPYNGFIVSDFPLLKPYYKIVEKQGKIIDSLRQFIESEFVFAQLYIPSHLWDCRSLFLNNWRFEPVYNVQLDLTHKPLVENLRRNQKRNILKVEKEGCEISLTEDVEKLYELYYNSYLHHHLDPPVSRKHFISFSSEILKAGIGKCYQTRKGKEITAVLLVIEDFPTIYTLLAGRVLDKKYDNAELYLYWKLMNIYQENGYKIMDMLGGMEPSITYVKMGLGGKLYRFDQVFYRKSNFYQILFMAMQRMKMIKRKA
jgi:hypothetical protein